MAHQVNAEGGGHDAVAPRSAPPKPAADPRGRDDTPTAAGLRAEERAVLRRRADGIGALIGDTANVFLQLAWPEIGYGVVESSVSGGQVMRHPFKRARTTLAYLGIALEGTQEQIDLYRQAVGTSHRQVRSGPDSPVKYNAFDRELQLWVASCLFYGFWDISVRMHGPMSPHDEEVLLRACARFGTSLQVPQDMWHQSMADFWRYWEQSLQRASIDDTVGAYFHDLLNLRMLPFPLDRLFGPVHAWFNTGLTPPEIRRQLGLRWTAADERRHDRALRALGVIYRRLPRVLRMFPLNAAAWATLTLHRFGRPMV